MSHRRARLTFSSLMGNLVKLDAIAKENGGNRAFGFSGYKASVDYILSRTQNSSNFITYVQDFPALWFQVKSISFTVDNQSYWVVGPTYSPSTSAEGLTAPLVLGVNGPEGGFRRREAEAELFDVLGTVGIPPILAKQMGPDSPQQQEIQSQ